MMGDTGPCGPCSEVHVDLTPDGNTRGSLVNKGDPGCIEIWNLVFIQFNANPDGTFTPLPQRHVDTGMGFERITAMIQGTKGFNDFSGTVSNYETDVFRPIFDELERLSGKKYASTLPHSVGRGADAPSRVVVGAPPTASGEAPGGTPEPGVLPRTEQEKIDVAFPRAGHRREHRGRRFRSSPHARRRSRARRGSAQRGLASSSSRSRHGEALRAAASAPTPRRRRRRPRWLRA